MLKVSQDERGLDDAADFVRAGGDVLQRAPAADKQGKGAFVLTQFEQAT